MDPSEVDGVIARVLAGQTEAYAEIIRLFQKDVWKVVAAMLHGRQITEDFVQQVFINAYVHLDRFEPGRDFGVWIKSIARNVVRENLRARAREGARLKAYRDHLAARFQDDEGAERRERELADAQAKCRETLPEQASRILELRYERSLSFEEIAGALGRSIEAVRQQLWRLRLTLRECIERRMAQV